jgi:hypothetical protein
VIKGSLNLEDAHARVLVDVPESWPRRLLRGVDGKKLRCEIGLDGFTYDHLGYGAPTDAERRLDWLSRHPHEHVEAAFCAQPFEQLIKVLRGMGYDGDAKQIAIAKLRMRRWAKWSVLWRNFIGWPRRWYYWPFKPLQIFTLLKGAIEWFLQWLVLDLFLNNGYGKIGPLVAFGVILGGCAFYYEYAAQQSVFVPANPVVYNDPEIRRACAGTEEAPDVTVPINWYSCKKAPAELNPFRPLVYSLDLMLPVIQLGQKRDWQPMSKEVRFDASGIGQLTLPPMTTLIVTWSQVIGSLLLYSLIGAMLGGLIKRD